MLRNLGIIGLLAVLLSGCVSGTGPATAPASGGVARSNSVIASEFLSLVFETENGTRIPRLLRYEAPIRVSLAPNLGAYRADLEGVLANIRRGSDIDITMGSAAQIHVQQVPLALFKRYFPTAACVVVPGVSSFTQVTRGNYPRWSSQRQLERAAVFIPDNAAPYIVRACLNEEIAQALGPVNDLYRVSDTVFNDDNVYNSLTAYDLLILRVLYDPRLSTGLSRNQAQPIVSQILQSLNRAGNRSGQVTRESTSWEQRIETAMNTANPRPERIAAATKAVASARRFGGHRLAHSLLIYGRLTLQNQPELAGPAFREAYALSQSLLGPNSLRTALAAMHLAAIEMKDGKFEEVISLTTPALATAERYRDPVMQAGIQSLRALAYTQLGQNRLAEQARLASLAQARYAFGENAGQIASSQAQIDGLIPARN